MGISVLGFPGGLRAAAAPQRSAFSAAAGKTMGIGCAVRARLVFWHRGTFITFYLGKNRSGWRKKKVRLSATPAEVFRQVSGVKYLESPARWTSTCVGGNGADGKYYRVACRPRRRAGVTIPCSTPLASWSGQAHPSQPQPPTGRDAGAPRSRGTDRLPLRAKPLSWHDFYAENDPAERTVAR